MIALLIAAQIAGAAMPDKDGGIPVTFHTNPEGAEVLIVPAEIAGGGIHLSHQCTAPCVLRIFPDAGFKIFAVAPHQTGRPDRALRLLRLENGRYGLSSSELTFNMRPNPDDPPPAGR